MVFHKPCRTARSSRVQLQLKSAVTTQLLVLTIVRSQLLIGFQDTGKRTQLPCLDVPA